MHSFTNQTLMNHQFEGLNWSKCCDVIIETCPQNIYISCDVDGLHPGLCPSTGTPLPGGLSYEAVIYLFEKVVQSGKKVIGFDLVETGSKTALDAITSAKLLQNLCSITSRSQLTT